MTVYSKTVFHVIHICYIYSIHHNSSSDNVKWSYNLTIIAHPMSIRTGVLGNNCYYLERKLINAQLYSDSADSFNNTRRGELTLFSFSTFVAFKIQLKLKANL